MTTIKDWLTLTVFEQGLNYDYETAIKAQWPFVIVEDSSRISTEPTALTNQKQHLIAKAVQRAIRKIQKAAEADDLYVLVMPTRADNYQFLIGATNEEELAIVMNGFTNHKRFKIV
jgi:hypothetical protein